MRLSIGLESISRRLFEKVGDGKIVLFKYGPGSGGDMLLKQFLAETPEGVSSVILTTHYTEMDLIEQMGDLETNHIPEIVSVLPFIDRRLNDIRKHDRFMTEGIMVTDLLEIASNTDEMVRETNPHLRMLAAITITSVKQILPYRMVLDSVSDMVEESSREDVVDRLRILKSHVKERKGMILVACDLGWMGLDDHQTSLFDAVVEVIAEKDGENWSRTLTIKNVKGSGQPPEEWQVTPMKEIPSAISID